MMKTFTVYDPPMCCSTGVCGPNMDPLLLLFAGMLARLAEQGVSVERHNLAQKPAAFARNAEVRSILEKEGPDALPLIFIDGKLEMKGRYPDTAERATFVQMAGEKSQVLG